jgi:uncharacterized protein (DUF1778 family)
MPASARSKRPVRELKRERLELRVAASKKQVIQRAMAISGMTAGEIAYEGAKHVLEDHERMILADRDRQVFLAALLNPPEPTERLISAFKRHRALFG